jgi:murein peptide amidase A
VRAGPLIVLALAGLALAALGVSDVGGTAAPATPSAALAELERAVAPRRDLIRRTTAIVGRSSEDRPIKAIAVNGGARDDRGSGPRVLAIGCIHGDECAGIAAVRRAYFCRRPDAGDLIVVRNLNPDGLALGTRLNGRGVDLNRNFASDWRPIGRGDPEHSGPAAFSEPEARIARRLIRRLRPEVTIWFHQQAVPLVRAWGPSVPAARVYARLARLPFHRLPWMDGTAPNWQNHRFRGTSSFVVELPAAGPVHSDRHAAAILALAGELMRGPR